MDLSDPPSTLPAPRTLLTALIVSLPGSARDVQPATADLDVQPIAAPQLPAEAQPILAALHALFPSLLLPALDLLDRGLVFCLVPGTPPDEPPSSPPPHQQRPAAPAARAPASPGTHLHASQSGTAELPSEARSGARRRNNLYLVCSAQSTHHRQPQPASIGFAAARASDEQALSFLLGETTTYTVRPVAWNCTCAAFTFAAFPARSASTFRAPPAARGQQRCTAGDGGGEPQWAFGGLSRDSHGVDDRGTDVDDTGGGGPADAQLRDAAAPCCKHLLACVLADRWRHVLGRQVRTIRLNSFELAGLACGG